MRAILRQLERGERCWPAEIVLRGLGLALLGLCAVVAFGLHRSVHRLPVHAPDPFEIAEAGAVCLCWSFGGLLLIEGSGLFRHVVVPSRHRRFPPVTEGSLHE